MIELPELDNLVAVGSVTERSVRLWFRSERPGRFALRLWREEDEASADEPRHLAVPWDAARDGTGAFTYPDDLPGAVALAPESRYRFRIAREETGGGEKLVGEGRFETAPPRAAQRTKLAFAFMSCHQPFRRDGALAPRAARMLELIGPTLDRHGVKYTLFLGDQIYADEPRDLSLFGPGGALATHFDAPLGAAEVRAAYHARYRQFWRGRFGALFSRGASYAAIDDHEVFDNWGSLPEHQADACRALSVAAREAAFDYQFSRSLPDARRKGPFYYSFDWGRSATFIADVRTERAARGSASVMMSDEQLGALARFLEQHAESSALFIAFSVPLVFLPAWFERAGFALGHPSAYECWSWEGWKPHRDAVLDLLFAHRARHPAQPIALLSGDVHEAFAAALRAAPERQPLYQLVSSPVSNTGGSLLQSFAHWASGTTRSIEYKDGLLSVERLPGLPDANSNPHADLNVGIVEMDAGPERCNLRFKVLSPNRDATAIETVFDSGPLG